MKPKLNPTVRYVDLKVKDHTYKIALDFNAIAEAEAVCGANLFQALNWSRANASQWRGVLWAALLKAQPDTTLEQAGSLVQQLLFDKKGITSLRTALDEAMANSMPDADPTQPEQE